MTDYTNQWDKETAGSNILGTDFDSKTNTTAVTLATVLDNSDALYTNIAMELVLGSITPAAGGYITVELFGSFDGTNYNDILAGATDFSLSRSLTTSASAKRIMFGFDNLRPYKYKIVITNNAGVTTAASGNALKIQRFREKGVGP